MTGRSYPERPVLAVSVALIRDGKALIARRARAPLVGVYAFPGGGVETGETLIAAAKRELKEECGLDADVLSFIDHVEPILWDGDRVEAHYVIAVFAARWIGGEPAPTEELDAFAWVDARQARAYRTTPELPDLIDRALARFAAAA